MSVDLAVNCHPEEDFSPTKDLRFVGEVEVAANRRSFDCASARRASAS
jgi:hypothetical protein